MDLINNKEDREKAINAIFEQNNKHNTEEPYKKDITYRDYKFRIVEINKKYQMAVYLEAIGYIVFKICNNKSECWDALNNFKLSDLFT